MEILFIPAKIQTEVNEQKIKSLSKRLPQNIAIVYPIQYKDIAMKIKKVLPNNVTKIVQMLGCSKLTFPKETQAVVLVGSGEFHTISLAISTKLPIYMLEQNKLQKISESDLESFKKHKKASYLNFLHAEQAGVLVSTKPGQEKLKKAIELKRKVKDKKLYLFISNDIDVSGFENFGLQSWVNTACPRLDMNSSRIINLSNLNFSKSK